MTKRNSTRNGKLALRFPPFPCSTTTPPRRAHILTTRHRASVSVSVSVSAAREQIRLPEWDYDELLVRRHMYQLQVRAKMKELIKEDKKEGAAEQQAGKEAQEGKETHEEGDEGEGGKKGEERKETHKDRELERRAREGLTLNFAYNKEYLGHLQKLR